MCGTCLLYCLDKNHQCLRLLASEPSTESLAPPLCSLVHLVPVPDGCRFGNGVGRRETWKDLEKELPVRASGSTWDPQDHALLAHPGGMSWTSRGLVLLGGMGRKKGHHIQIQEIPPAGRLLFPSARPSCVSLALSLCSGKDCPICHLSPAHLSLHVWGKGK